MTLVAVVIPTIDGREALLERTLAAYRDQREPGMDVRVVVVRNRPTIGQGWEAGRRVVHDQIPEAQWVNLSADDVEPQPGALRAALDTAFSIQAYPSPRLLNVDGSLHSCGTLGAGLLLPEVDDLSPAGSSPFPFLAEHHLSALPPIPAIHYYADDWLAYQARHVLGLQVVVDRRYCLTHLEGTAGRPAMQARAMEDRAAMLRSLAVQEPRSVRPAAFPIPPLMQAPEVTR